MPRTPRIAVLLAGCGHLDGAEVREAVLTLLALDQHGAEVQCLAPDAPQFHVIDHRSGQVVDGASRNMLEEASRISRVGKCMGLEEADPTDFDALLIPGGYGVAKNHCDFAFRGAGAEVRADVAAFVGGFFQQRKPVGAICVSPALVALVLSQSALCAQLTLGDGDGPSAALEALGHKPCRVSSAREIVIDESLNLVSTAAYMFDEARLSDVWVGIERCVDEVLQRV